jgi:hypothetical protein
MTNSSTITQNASEFLAAFQGAVDGVCTTGRMVDMEKFIRGFKLKFVDVEQIQQRLLAATTELELLILGDDELADGYSNLPIATQRNLLTMHHAVMSIPSKKVTKAAVEADASDDDMEAPAVDAKAVARHKAKLAKTTKPTKAEAVIEAECDAIYAPSAKYKIVRVFKGNVKVMTGDKVIADSMQEIKLGKKFSTFKFTEDMTQDEIEAIIAQGTVSTFVPSTISKAVVDLVVVF